MPCVTILNSSPFNFFISCDFPCEYYSTNINIHLHLSIRYRYIFSRFLPPQTVLAQTPLLKHDHLDQQQKWLYNVIIHVMSLHHFPSFLRNQQCKNAGPVCFGGFVGRQWQQQSSTHDGKGKLLALWC